MCAAVADADNYYKSLGRFVHTYATVEIAAQVILWVHIRVDMDTAKALLGGTRVRDAMSKVKRIREAMRIAETSPTSKLLENIFSQLADITSARDDIFHYGAWVDPDGTQARVSNWRHAYSETKLREFRISAEALNDMTADLETCANRLIALSEIVAKMRDLRPEDVPDEWKQPWRYKFSSQVIHPKRPSDTCPKS